MLPGRTVTLLEKEEAVAAHQTGRNSGVIHAGIYYAPGSLKAEFCRRGLAMTVAFCREHALPYDQRGKLIVANSEPEMERMAALEDRARRNGLPLERLDRAQLRHLGHLRTKDGIIKIVIPTILKASFPKDHFSENAIIPDNIPLMPMPEGSALANLVSGISDAIRGVDIKFVTHNDFVDDGVTPFVSIGGPSVNEVSREILNQMVPGFRIQYPDHIGYFGSRKMSPRVEKGILLEDFGFLFQGKIRLGLDA